MDALQAHGVSQEQTDTLLAWADDFNARVTTPTLTEGFTAMEGDFVDYSSLLFDIKELPDGTFFMEANCRPDRVPVEAGSAPDLWDCGGE